MTFKQRLPSCIVGLMTGVLATYSFGADVQITDEVIRAVPVVSSNSAGYMTLLNKNSKTIRLESVDTDLAARTEIHGNAMKNGMMTMYKVTEGLELPPGKPVKLESGGFHVMLMGLKAPFRAGDSVELTLHFSDGDAVDVKVPVKQLDMDKTIRLENGSARATVPGMSSSAAYFTINNDGKEAVTISSIDSPVAKKSELHTTYMKDGMMRMKEVEAMSIAAGEQLVLKPGSYHVMLMGLTQRIKSGDKVPVTIRFSNGEKATIDAMAMEEIKGQGMAH